MFRYKIISAETCETSDFVCLDLAAFNDKDAAISVCRVIREKAYVIDSFTSETLYKN